jgi:MoaA/NifB/PqqE/SkfB family radical SAM enzyme
LTRDKALALKQAGLFAVGISLDSDEAAEMDARRGCAGAFDRAVQAVRICRETGLYTMTQTVAERDSVRSGKLHRIVSLSGTIGAHEVRVLETMPSGRLARIAADRILSAEDREELKRFHTAMNRKRNMPKVSVFAHTEDAQRYGCGAGTQHSYLDASGNLYPCDFVPLSFGNIRDQPIAGLWRDMHKQIGMPRQGCMIMELYSKQLLSDKVSFPVAPPQSETFVRQLDVMHHMPGFYRRLAGHRETHRG